MYTEWINYIRMLGSNEFPLKNIVHLLFLDICRWYKCGNTVSMRYSPEIKHFWLLGYKLFHGKFLRCMARFRHVGFVKDGSNARSFYNPTDISMNFAVPAVHVLAKSATIKPSEIKPEILTQMLDLFRSNHMKTFKLCVDGKTLNVSSSQVDGELNLFGLEDKPTFNDNTDKLKRGQVFIKEIDDILMNLQRRDKMYIYISEIHSEQNLLKSKLKALIQLAGNSIQDLRKAKVKKNVCIGIIQKTCRLRLVSLKIHFRSKCYSDQYVPAE